MKRALEAGVRQMKQLRSGRASNQRDSEGLRMARYVNIGVWFYLLASDVLNPVVARDYWDGLLNQAFSLNRRMFEPAAMARETVLILLLWFAVDLLLRWLWSQGRGDQQRED